MSYPWQTLRRTVIAFSALIIAMMWMWGLSQLLWAQHTEAILHHGQGSMMHQHARRDLEQDLPPQEVVDRLVGRDRPLGLFTAAIVDRDTREVIATAGTPLPGALPEQLDNPSLIRLRSSPEAPSVLYVGPVDDNRALAMVYRPTLSHAVGSRGRQLLFLVLVATLLTVAGAGGFVYVSRQLETTQLQADKDRHLAHLGELSAVMAHEIRNPLASIKGHAQLLVECADDPEEVRELSGWVVRETERLEKLTHNLLQWARSGELDTSDFGPATLTDAATAELSEPRIEVDLSAAPAAMHGDLAKLRQVVVNLLRNALQSAPDGPITLTVATEGPNASLTVRDHGPGFEGDPMEHFTAFKTTRTQGTGLGLAFVQRVVQQHHGAVTAHNADDGGAVVRITLPGGPS